MNQTVATRREAVRKKGESMLRSGRLAAALLAALVCAGSAWAQNYPTRTIRLILPVPPGGPSDLLGRPLAQKLGEQMGVQVVVDNRPGAGGHIGLELAARSAPDGYTLVLGAPPIAIGPSLYAKLNYDPQKDLAPISLAAVVHNVLLVHPSVPARTLKELIELARSQPGKLNYGSGGVGVTSHLAPELLQSLAKVKMVHVPFKGVGQAVVGLLSGEIDVLVMGAPAAASHVAAGKARPLAVLSETRAPALPKVPTAREAGVEHFAIDLWYGVLGPAGTAPAIVTRLNAEIHKALGAPDLRQKLLASGIEPRLSTPEAFAGFIRSETVRFAKVIKDAGIKPE